MLGISIALANINEAKNTLETINKKIDSKIEQLQKSNINNRSLLDLMPIIDLLFDYYLIGGYEYDELLLANKEYSEFFNRNFIELRTAFFALLNMHPYQGFLYEEVVLLTNVYYNYKTNDYIAKKSSDEEEKILDDFISNMQRAAFWNTMLE